jgi:hypothetical protein
MPWMFSRITFRCRFAPPFPRPLPPLPRPDMLENEMKKNGGRFTFKYGFGKWCGVKCRFIPSIFFSEDGSPSFDKNLKGVKCQLTWLTTLPRYFWGVFRGMSSPFT